MLNFSVCYCDSNGRVTWEGRNGIDRREFAEYVENHVHDRLEDQDHLDEIAYDLEALATTDMATDTLRGVLESQTSREGWEIGEALAECLLRDEQDVIWFWNMRRDELDPNASLPGADLIGFIEIDGETRLLIGEVKTSADTQTPPGVMNGRSGMTQQLEKHTDATRRNRLHKSIFRWVHARTKDTSHWHKFQEAFRLYLKSHGEAVALYGVLLRDTDASQLDLKNRASSLARDLNDQLLVKMFAWYLPVQISNWPDLISN